MQTIYIEKEITDHPRVKEILERWPQSEKIECTHYSELFNIHAQNFRLQKQNPVLILAQKRNRRVLPTPPGFGIGGQHNYYFSHLLNCPYDCRYCFLQGMYRSANYVLFVNYQDFMNDIATIIHSQPENLYYFFSGYDSDSLAFDPITGFIDAFIPFFSKYTQAILELRTKSVAIRSLLKRTAIPNCVVAFSLTPQKIAEMLEHGAPSLSKRLTAMQQLAQAGWKIGLRLDPLIYTQTFEKDYSELIERIFEFISPNIVHSVSVGVLRFPHHVFQRITNLYPEEPLFAQSFTKQTKQISYDPLLELKMKAFVHDKIKQYIDEKIIFNCEPT